MDAKIIIVLLKINLYALPETRQLQRRSCLVAAVIPKVKRLPRFSKVAPRRHVQPSVLKVVLAIQYHLYSIRTFVFRTKPLSIKELR